MISLRPANSADIGFIETLFDLVRDAVPLAQAVRDGRIRIVTDGTESVGFYMVLGLLGNASLR